MPPSGDPEVFDITVIGAGPTGLFGAFYAGMRGMRCKLLDALPQPGGQVTALYPEKVIFDTPGFPAIVGRELVQNLVKQCSRWGTVLALGEQAQTLTQVPLPQGPADKTCFAIATDAGTHLSKSVVIAAGIGAFRPVKLDNPTIEKFEGKGVEYFVTDLEVYRDKRVLIVGGGDSAVDWALAMEPLAESVTLAHRREGFRAHESSVAKLMASKVHVLTYFEVKELQGDGHVEHAVVFDNRTQAEQTLDVDGVILALGFKADLGPIREWGIETVGRRYIRVNNRMETNMPGVYAAGDLALQEGLDPLNLIVMGYAQATVAVNYAYTYVNPGAKVFPGHSSEKMADQAGGASEATG
jgi:ferredoxin/flavodoxin---NADP+ reductase